LIEDALAGLLTATLGVLAVRYHVAVAAGFRRVNEWTYRHLPNVIGGPLEKLSPAFHSAMAYLIFAWGCVCVLCGALITVYAVAR
jgi:hypothetical protein